MPPKPSKPHSPDSKQSSRQSLPATNKFIPNLTQVNEAAKELPDPDIWPESSYHCPLAVNGKQQSIEFYLKLIHRGKEQAPRWIFEGKILIRKRDV